MSLHRFPTSVSRRDFLTTSAATAAAWSASWETSAPGEELSQSAARALQEPHDHDRTPVIDCHAHLRHHRFRDWEAYDQKLIEAADLLGIDLLCCSMLTPRRPATTEGYQECNRWVAQAVQRYPDRILGYSYVNPGTGQDALDEVRRCIEQYGFIGIKLYNEHFCTDPLVFPVVELAIDLGVPILQHAGHMHYFLEAQPRISDGGHIAELAKRYPEAMLICAHICGGGDWEWTIKALRNAPSVFLDTSGSVTDDGVIELAVKTLGADRLLFGCDMSMTAGMGRLRGAELEAEDRTKILGGNMQQILARVEAQRS
jgi:uncharacterized protein